MGTRTEPSPLPDFSKKKKEDNDVKEVPTKKPVPIVVILNEFEPITGNQIEENRMKVPRKNPLSFVYESP